MPESASKSIQSIMQDIEKHAALSPFYFGKLYGQLTEILKKVEEQEKAYEEVCKWYVATKPAVLEAIEFIAKEGTK